MNKPSAQQESARLIGNLQHTVDWQKVRLGQLIRFLEATDQLDAFNEWESRQAGEDNARPTSQELE